MKTKSNSPSSLAIVSRAGAEMKRDPRAVRTTVEVALRDRGALGIDLARVDSSSRRQRGSH